MHRSFGLRSNPMTKAPSPRSRPTRSDAQRQAILDAACLLFIDKGFGGTNINDIADAVGVTRTALYYYFPSKESMLEALTEEVTEKASRIARSVSGRDELPADEALRLLILQHAGLILSHPLHFRVVERSEGSLPEPHLFRRGDARVAAFSSIGMCNWGAWWFDAEGDVPAETVTATLADYGLRMLRPDRPRRAAARGGTDEAIAQLRDALDLLEADRGKG
jgi:AcrR family transcriptional regulator